MDVQHHGMGQSGNDMSFGTPELGGFLDLDLGNEGIVVPPITKVGGTGLGGASNCGIMISKAERLDSR